MAPCLSPWFKPGVSKREKGRKLVILVLAIFLILVPGPAFAGSINPPSQEELLKPVGVIFFDLNGSAAVERNEQIQNQEMPIGDTIYTNYNDVLATVNEPSWLNIPMTRLRFDTAEDYGVGLFARSTSKTLGSALASVADGLLIQASMFVNWGIEIIYLAFRSNWIAALASQVTVPTQTLWQSLFGSGLGNSSLFGLFIMALFGYLLFYLARMQFMRIMKAIVMSILILTLAFAYFSNAGKVLMAVSNTADSLSGIVLSTVGGALSAGSEQSGFDSMLQNFSSSLWCGLVANTWSALEFGTTKPQDLLLTDEEYQRMKSNTTISENSYDPNSRQPKKINPFNAGWIQPGSRIDQVVLSYSVNNVARGEIINVLADPDIDHGKHAIARESLLPYNKIKCIVFTFFFQFVGLVFLIFCIIIGGSMIIAQFTLLGIALALPIIFLVALIPETGWNIGYKTGKMAVAALGTKMVYGVFLSLIVLIVNFIFWLIN